MLSRGLLFLFTLCALAACQGPEGKYATEMAQTRTLRNRLWEMHVKMSIDDSLISARTSVMGREDSSLIDSVLTRTNPELQLSLAQYHGIPRIYHNYLSGSDTLRQALLDEMKAVDDLELMLTGKKLIGRREFRRRHAIHAAYIDSLGREVENTAGKVLAVEPVYRRMQPYVDSLQLMPGPSAPRK